MQPLNKALSLRRMNERTRTIALLAHGCNVVVIGGYRGAYRGLSTHSSTGMTSSTPTAAARVTRAARQKCRRAERRWQKDRLHVSYGIFKESLFCYQRIVKAEKSKYLSEIIASNYKNLSALFKTINTVLLL